MYLKMSSMYLKVSFRDVKDISSTFLDLQTSDSIVVESCFCSLR